MKGAYPGIDKNDRVILWGGGIWEWFDPLTLIRAVHRINQERRQRTELIAEEERQRQAWLAANYEPPPF